MSRPITPPRPPSFAPECVYSNGYGVAFTACGVNLEVRTVAALNEIAWEERISRAVLIEEIVVAYARDRFPDRFMPTREEARYEEEWGEEAVALIAELKPGVRHYEHNEQQWRKGERARAVAE